MVNRRDVPRHSRRVGCSLLFFALMFPLAGPASALVPSSPGNAFELGRQAFERGALEDAVAHWTEAARASEAAHRPDGQLAALTHLSDAYAALGRYRQVVKTLDTALALIQSEGESGALALILEKLGSAYIAIGPPQTAEAYLTRSLAIATDRGDAVLSAVVHNDLGNLWVSQKKYTAAIADYRESGSLATRLNQHSLAARALANAAAALQRSGAPQESADLLDRAFDELRVTGPSHEAAFTLVNIGLAYRDLRPALAASADRLGRQAVEAFSEAGTIADRLGDRRAASYAWGYLGALYEDEHRYAEALRLTRRATFAAQQISTPESLYRWQWQAGRLLLKLGTLDEAIEAYRRAVSTLQSIRSELSVDQGAASTSFRESVGPVYFQLVDLLLRRAASLQKPEQIARVLKEARETVELLKVAELRDYFRDDCVDAALAKVTTLDVVSKTTVVVYPILLPDRLELLVSFPGGLKRFSVPVGADTLAAEVREFRRTLEKRTTREYLGHAQRLYRWLVAPLEADLKPLHIETLVFVPDGPLRTIPMAALHDGTQFLINRYALAITPGLDLTDPRPIERTHMKVLAVGVTEPVQGFPALPNVSTELQTLRTLFGSTTLVDKAFVVSNLAEKLKEEPFTIVHIASHGQFGSDVGSTFVLSFDEKLTMDRLAQLVGVFRFREEPLELLTLSACDTAAGDERAALGLAGVAIKAGARSAVATLWDINDPASSELVANFYTALKDPSVSRARALQRAQLTMLDDPRYEHPGFWAPFLLINNWL
jgi:CHAT domain-containing protein